MGSSPPPTSAGVTISAVICTQNRPGSLMSCVRSIARQSVRPLEVIVVDDGDLSRDEREELASLCTSAGMAFLYLPKDRPGLTRSRNLAVRHARGDIVQFLDDDVTLDAGFCGEIQRLYTEDADGSLLGTEGRLMERTSPSWGMRAADVVYRLAGWWGLRPRPLHRPPPPACFRDARRAKPVWNVVGATMAFRRSALENEPFDEALPGYGLGEDRDMAYRLGRRGWIARCLTARATHHHDPTSRTATYTFGRMAVRHYVRIMTRNGLTGVGDRLVIVHSLITIATSLLVFSLVKPRRCLPEFVGMAAGALDIGREVLTRCLYRDGWRSPEPSRDREEAVVMNGIASAPSRSRFG